MIRQVRIKSSTELEAHCESDEEPPLVFVENRIQIESVLDAEREIPHQRQELDFHAGVVAVIGKRKAVEVCQGFRKRME